MDRLTLFSMQGGLLIFLGIVTFLAGRAQRKTRGDESAFWFSLGYVIGGIGLVLQAYRGIIAPFYAIILGNFLFFFTFIGVERAIAITTKRKNHTFSMFALSTAVILSYVYFTYFKPNVMVRTIEAIIVMTTLLIPIWVHLIRSKEQAIRPAIRAMSLVLLVHALLNLMRIVPIMIFRNADAWFTWLGVISIAALALCFMWIDALRIRHVLEHSAMTDPLTGLHNRRALDEFGVRELHRSSRLGLPWSALAIDLNRFKQINDTYGHSTGDRALCAVATALRTSLRLSDLATRIGGDEFLVLLPNADEKTADEVADRLRRAVQTTKVETSIGEWFSISISIGSVTLRGKSMSISDLIHESDMKLYEEKRKFALLGDTNSAPQASLHHASKSFNTSRA